MGNYSGVQLVHQLRERLAQFGGGQHHFKNHPGNIYEVASVYPSFTHNLRRLTVKIDDHEIISREKNLREAWQYCLMKYTRNHLTLKKLQFVKALSEIFAIINSIIC